MASIPTYNLMINYGNGGCDGFSPNFSLIHALCMKPCTSDIQLSSKRLRPVYHRGFRSSIDQNRMGNVHQNQMGNVSKIFRNHPRDGT